MKLHIILISFLFCLFNYKISSAINLIRDDEIETAIYNVVMPIIKVSNIDPKNLQIYIVDDPTINAFTPGENLIFINSGLLTSFDDPAVIQGVIAHEIGHLKAGHVTKKMVEHRQVSKNLTMINLIGIFGSIVSKNPDIAQSIGHTSITTAMHKISQNSRQYEKEADKIALQLLEKSKLSPHGLEKLLNKLSLNENHNSYPYFRTHPFSHNRKAQIKEFQKNHRDYQNIDLDTQIQYDRAIAKLKSFIKFQDRNKPKQHDSFITKYCLAIELYLKKKFTESLTNILDLIKLEPNNPYLHEFAGQVYFALGKIKESTASYSYALSLKPKSELFKSQLAANLIRLGDQHSIEKATQYLQALAINHDSSYIQHYLSIAYGKQNKLDLAKLAISKKHYLQGDCKQAIIQAKEAIKLTKNPFQKEKAEDIIQDCKEHQ